MILLSVTTKNKLNFGLYIVSTPIGNLSDITLRAISVLSNSEYILCEDTRTSKKLLEKYKIQVPVFEWENHSYLRYSIQAYNSEDDLEKLFTAVKELLN